MRDDNNPFSPALNKPVDDTVLANDPAADNFLAGNDNLAQSQSTRPTMDSFAMPTQPTGPAPAHLDQMNNSTMPDQPATTPATDDISSSTSNSTPSTNLFEALSAQTDTPTSPAKEKKAKKSLLPRKKKSKQTEAPTPTSVFGDVAGSTTTPTSPIDFSAADSSTSSLDVNPVSAMDGFNDDSTNTSASDISPISASLATAASVADSKSSGLDLGKKGKNGQPKQLTISVLTIVFFVLFIASAGAAAYFFMQNNDNKSQLADAQAELQKLKDENDTSSNTSNKTSTQFDALQDKIAELTKQGDEKQKTIDESKKAIEDLNKKNSDLNTQLTAANNKLTSDKTVADNMKSLMTTMCTMPGMEGSSACVSNQQQGQTNGTVQQQPQAQ